MGVTNSLEQRIAEHGAREIAGFTRSYGIERLVFFRGFGEVTEAIHFEKPPSPPTTNPQRVIPVWAKPKTGTQPCPTL